MKKKKEDNPFFTKKCAWLWLVCAPVALVGSAVCESKTEQKKKAKKKEAKEEKFRRKYPEFDRWQDNQGL